MVTVETDRHRSCSGLVIAFTVCTRRVGGSALLSKVALQDLGTKKFYLLSAVVSLVTYAPYLSRYMA